MQSEIFFSVVIPTYNRAQLLSKTIKSFLAQSFKAFEIIVVDDGGSDYSRNVVESFKDSRLSYYWKANAERGAARNYGVQLAKGYWINFFDSDDLAYPHHLQTAYEFIKNNKDVKVFHTSFDWVDIQNGNVFQRSVTDGVLNSKIQRANCLSCNNVFIERETAKLFPFSEIRDLSGSEDWLLWLRLSAYFSITGISSITSSIVQHGSRSMVTASGESTEIRSKRLTQLLKEDNDLRIQQMYGRASAEMYSLTSLHYALEGNRKAAARTIRVALLASPSLIFSRRFLAIMKYAFLGKRK